MTKPAGRVHVDSSRRHYTAADGSVKEYRRHLLRRSFRDDRGKPAKETLANLSALPDDAIEVLRKVLAGSSLVDTDTAFEIERTLPHGDVAAAHAMATKLGFPAVLGPAGRNRDVAYALLLSRIVHPASKLSTTHWWNDTTIGVDFGMAGIHTDEVYSALDWLLTRQPAIEKTLAHRHLTSGGIAMFDLSSSWVEGRACELAAFGYSRDGRRGTRQVEYGLLTDPAGRPVAIRVFPGNTSDPAAFTTIVNAVRDDFGLDTLTMVGDRGMITSARVRALRDLPGMDWVTALRAPAIAALAADDGPLQMSLFDTQNFAEITHPDYPGERLVCCRNPALADERARKRDELLAATETHLEKIHAQVTAGRLTGADAIGIKVGRTIGKHKVGKHFIVDITDTSITWRRDTDKIAAEAALDGIYVLRTSLPTGRLDTPGVITTYKDLARVERDFRTIKADDIDLRPIYHYLADRVRAHIFLCMLATHITWHLRRALTPLTFTDENIPERPDPVTAAKRSATAKTKDARKKNADNLPTASYQDVLGHLATLTRATAIFAGQRIEKISNPTAVQRHAFELIGAPIPLSLSGK
jgi:hypothetical protein